VQLAVLPPAQLPPHACPAFTHCVRAPCGCPEVTGLQVPGTTSQAWHCPPHAELQHTPSTQLPEPHSLAVAQTTPVDFLALQLPLVQK
jgi:hypothetical protein